VPALAGGSGSVIVGGGVVSEQYCKFVFPDWVENGSNCHDQITSAHALQASAPHVAVHKSVCATTLLLAAASHAKSTNHSFMAPNTKLNQITACVIVVRHRSCSLKDGFRAALVVAAGRY
jgi:hypothetical protein